MTTELTSLLTDFRREKLLSFFNQNSLFAADQKPLVGYEREGFVLFEELGEFKLEDKNRILVVAGKKEKALNERSSRKLQFEISKKILTEKPQFNAGLFVYHDDSGNFRLSLIYKDFEGTRVKLSVYKRFSYFVEKGRENKTFKDRVGSVDFKSIDELKEVFSVEKVTKEFFEHYKNHFFNLAEQFEANQEFQNEVVIKCGIRAEDFTKKLMGQIVFLYFLQRKGWLGVRPGGDWGTGDQHYMRTLFESSKNLNKNFYNQYLEPLFYGCLGSADRGNKGATNDQSFAPEFGVRIPYLNGGLFEDEYDWKNTEINIDNDVFGKLLTFFDQYNFTVDENTPSDQEVSVDPEMLGKIFENLLDVKDRHSTGAYYTPREIVHYMCRESLVNYLVSRSDIPEERIRGLFDAKDTELFVLADDTGVEKIRNLKDLKDIAEKVDTLLRDVKIVDPAVGSGAFPMGMLSEISSTRYYLNNNFLHRNNDRGVQLSLYDIKRETLENCIYGVDLNPGAVEIAKLRFWLALVVDHSIGEVEALPNLDYKIMQGNSLLEEFEGVKLFDDALITATDMSQVKDLESLKTRQGVLQKEYLSLHAQGSLSDEKKELLDSDLKKLSRQIKLLSQPAIAGSEKAGLFDATSNAKQKADELKRLHREFFRLNEKSSKQRIKNQISNLEWDLIEETLKEQNKISSLSKIQEYKKSNTKPFFLWKLHFSDIFLEKGGFDVVIGNPPWGSELSKDDKLILKNTYPLIDSSTPNSFAYFLGLAFKISSKNVSFLLPDSILIKDYAKTRGILRPHLVDVAWYQNVGVPEEIRPFVNVEHDVVSLIMSSIKSDRATCSKSTYDTKERKIVKQVWRATKDNFIIEEFDNVINLLLTQEDLLLYNKVRPLNKMDRLVQCHEGIHTGNSREILFLHEKRNANCKPLFYGGGAGDIIRNYHSERSGWYVDYRKELISKEKGFYASLRDERIFRLPKIYITRTGNPFKAFVDEDTYASNNFFSLQFLDYSVNTIDRLNALLPFLISSFAQYYIRTFAAPRLGDTFIETKIIHLLKIPVPNLTPPQSSHVASLVLDICKNIKAGNDTEAKILEDKLDKFVLSCYGFTDEEKRTIENYVKNN